MQPEGTAYAESLIGLRSGNEARTAGKEWVGRRGQQGLQVMPETMGKEEAWGSTLKAMEAI